MMNQNKALTSVVSYPERGHGGNNRYRGNCSPKLIEDLITHFRPHEVCDYINCVNYRLICAQTLPSLLAADRSCLGPLWRSRPWWHMRIL